MRLPDGAKRAFRQHKADLSTAQDGVSDGAKRSFRRRRTENEAEALRLSESARTAGMKYAGKRRGDGDAAMKAYR